VPAGGITSPSSTMTRGAPGASGRCGAGGASASVSAGAGLGRAECGAPQPPAGNSVSGLRKLLAIELLSNPAKAARGLLHPDTGDESSKGICVTQSA
jgi:hypothetical protein